MSLETYFGTGAALERQVFDAVRSHLETLGPLHIEYVAVGVFFKRSRTFAELRPMRSCVRLSVVLSRRLRHPRIVKSYQGQGMRNAYFFDFRNAQEVDDEILDLLTEAYFSSPT